MNAGLLIIILLLGLALLGFPIYIALGIGALAALNLADLPLIVLPQRMFAGMNGSALLAIPNLIALILLAPQYHVPQYYRKTD